MHLVFTKLSQSPILRDSVDYVHLVAIPNLRYIPADVVVALHVPDDVEGTGICPLQNEASQRYDSL